MTLWRASVRNEVAGRPPYSPGRGSRDPAGQSRSIRVTNFGRGCRGSLAGNVAGCLCHAALNSRSRHGLPTGERVGKRISVGKDFAVQTTNQTHEHQRQLRFHHHRHGAGGGTLAYKLAPSGKRILLIERRLVIANAMRVGDRLLARGN